MKHVIVFFCVFMIYAAVSAQNIVQAEYFVNDDPGYGNGIAIPVIPGTDVTLNFNVNTHGLENGLHILFIRAKDNNGVWSSVVHRPFILGNYPADPLLQIIRAEYFIDEDPGHGLGIELPIPSGPAGEIEVVIPLVDVAHGWHTLYFRTKDENVQWSHTYSQPFLKLFIPDDPVSITHLEYFIDDDPGIGNGVSVAITPGSHVEQSFIIYPGPMPPGEYTLYVRARDDRGSWSIVFNQVFEVEPSVGCPPPNSLMATNITSNSATLGWNPGGAETEWEVLWGINGFNPENEGILVEGITSVPYFLGELLQSTHYEFYVRAVCDYVQSEWSEPGDFVTNHTVNHLHLTLILEGAYTPNAAMPMHTGLHDAGLVPMSQPFGPSLPYFGNPEPLWYYTGDELVESMPEGVVDWILLEYRDAPAAELANASTVVIRQAALLLNTGQIADVNGQLPVMDLQIEHNLFLVVYHRNHLTVMSAEAITPVDGVYTWDFTGEAGRAFSGKVRNAYQQGHKHLGNGIYGMYGGDGDGNGQVQTQDKNEVWNLLSGQSGYHAGDFDLNGQVQTQDKNEIWNPNSGVASQVP